MALVIIGGVLQIVGLLFAGVGLGQAWAGNPKPESLWWRIFGPPIRWVAEKVLRRPRHVTVNVAGVSASVSGLAAHITVGLNRTLSLQQQIQRLKTEVDAASNEAFQAHQLAQRIDRRLTEVETRLTDRLEQVRTEQETARRAAAADAVPLAAVGLFITALGTVLGLIGAVLTGS